MLPVLPALTLPTLKTLTLAQALVPEVECVTATRRQMHELLRADARAKVAAGHAAWRTARVLPWDALLGRAWTEAGGAAEALIGDGAARRLWREVIAASPEAGSLLDLRAAARSAGASHALAWAHDLEPAALEPDTVESGAFRRWAAEFDAFLRARGFLDRSQLPRALLARPPARPADGLALAGLQPLPAAHARLLAHWAAHGRTLAEVALPTAAAAPRMRCYTTVEEEFEAIAAWVVARQRATPGARLAVLLPGLKDAAPTLRRRLDDRLYPAALVPGTPPERPYALGAAPALSSHGVVHAALVLLRLARRDIDVADASFALRTPYLGGAGAEAGPRARVEALLREGGTARVTREGIERAAVRAGGGEVAVPAFLAALEALDSTLGTGRTQSLEAWAVALGRALAAAGWPGPRPLGSDEHQAVEKFQTALGELAALARVLGPQTLAGALAELTEIASTIEFQPEAGEPSVVFLDGPAALGYPVDGLWVAGLDAARFPSTLQPDPFLPLGAQRRAGIPGASPSDALEAARRLWADWSGWSTEFVASVALLDGDVEQRPSPFLRDAVAAEPIATLERHAARLHAGASRVAGEADVLAPLAAGLGIPGGGSALEDQSACPFRAAVRWRLSVAELPPLSQGLPATVRGDLAHHALAVLWDELKTSAALATLDGPAEAALVARAIDAAFALLGARAPEGRLAELERAWLARAIGRLLEVDRGREPFAVEAVERRHDLTLDGRTLRVRLDRVDRLADGRTALIDYKSGAGNNRRWIGERLRDVQLPLYAAHLPEAPAAVALARLSFGAAKPYTGYASDTGLLPGVGLPKGAAKDPSRTLGALTGQWRAQTEALAREFAAGRADVAPQKDACTYCTHGLVCRVVLDPADGIDAAPEDDEDE